MLALQRFIGQRIFIADNIVVEVVNIRPGKRGGRPYVTIGIEAPREIPVVRDDACNRNPKPQGEQP